MPGYNEKSESLFLSMERQTRAIEKAHMTLVELTETLDGHLALLELLQGDGAKIPRNLINSDMETVQESIGEVATAVSMIEKAFIGF